MGKYIVAAFILMIPLQSLYAQTCSELFQKNHSYYLLGKDIQMNILDLAENLSIYPNHKGMASEWSKYVVGRYGVDANIVQIPMHELRFMENSALKTYATAVRSKFLEQWNAIRIDETQTYMTFIFNRDDFISGSPLAAKIAYLKSKTYFDKSTSKIVITPYTSDSAF